MVGESGVWLEWRNSRQRRRALSQFRVDCVRCLTTRAVQLLGSLGPTTDSPVFVHTVANCGDDRMPALSGERYENRERVRRVESSVRVERPPILYSRGPSPAGALLLTPSGCPFCLWLCRARHSSPPAIS